MEILMILLDTVFGRKTCRTCHFYNNGCGACYGRYSGPCPTEPGNSCHRHAWYWGWW